MDTLATLAADTERMRIACLVFCTIPDPDQAAKEAFRVLKPGGGIWVETARPDDLYTLAEAAGLVTAEEPTEEDGVTHAIFRRPGDVR